METLLKINYENKKCVHVSAEQRSTHTATDGKQNFKTQEKTKCKYLIHFFSFFNYQASLIFSSLGVDSNHILIIFFSLIEYTHNVDTWLKINTQPNRLSGIHFFLSIEKNRSETVLFTYLFFHRAFVNRNEIEKKKLFTFSIVFNLFESKFNCLNEVLNISFQ